MNTALAQYLQREDSRTRLQIAPNTVNPIYRINAAMVVMYCRMTTEGIVILDHDITALSVEADIMNERSEGYEYLVEEVPGLAYVAFFNNEDKIVGILTLEDLKCMMDSAVYTSVLPEQHDYLFSIEHDKPLAVRVFEDTFRDFCLYRQLTETQEVVLEALDDEEQEDDEEREMTDEEWGAE